MPRVSVVVPTFDAVEYVGEALDSLLAQTYDDFEVLVVDDGSTDGTRETVREYSDADDRIRLIQRAETGLAAALNRGIDEAEGEYVARQDADDRSLPGRLARQVAFLDDHPDVALVGTGVYIVEDGRRVERRHVVERPEVADMESGNPFVHGSVCFRREAVREVGGYDESFDVSEDYDLWVRLADRFPVANVDEALYELRLHGESIYGSDLERVKLYRRYAFRRLQDDLPEGARDAVESEGIEALYDCLEDGERADHHAEMAMELLRYGDLPGAREQARASLAYRSGQPAAWGVLALSFTTQGLVNAAGRLYRAAKNYRVRTRNR